jgi:LPLT family lysophospholipid transporter-like MFS transporter
MKNTRNYHLLLTSQFLGAFGDNAILAVLLGPLMAAREANQITEAQQSIENIIYTSLLFVPYVLLAPLAGYLNDRYPKTRWLKGGNLIKLAGTILAASGLIGAGPLWQKIGYFVVGIGACIYSPAKYGILPEVVPAERLVKANGTVEFLTLVAILTGTIGGAAMYDFLPISLCYLILIVIYAISAGLNLLMQPTPAYPEVQLKNSAREFFENMGHILRAPRLSRILFGTVLFWICGAMLKMNFQPWGQQVLHLQSMIQISLLGLWLSLGIMAGSILAGQLYKLGDLHATRRWGWLLAASLITLGMTGWLMRHGLTRHHLFVIGVMLIAGLFAGLFLIPLNAALQAESHQDKLGKTIATQNMVENTAMLGGSAFAFVNVKSGFDPSQLFLVLGIALTVIVFWLRIPPQKN